jgi:hypothetical protein
LNFFDKNVDWDNINRIITNEDWTNIMDSAENVSQMKTAFDTTLLRICQENVPLRRKKKRRNCHHRKRRALMKKITILVKRLESEPRVIQIHDIETRLIRIEQEILYSHEEERSYNESVALEKIKSNSKYFFGYAAKFSSTRAAIGPFIEDDGSIIDDDKQMSEMLSQQYSKVFSTPIENIRDTRNNDYTNFDNIDLYYYHIEEAIDELKINSSAGPDEIPAVVLKKCKFSLSRPLTLLWRKSLESADIPNTMKHAVIFPLHKGGNRTSPANYRPVSLTSHVIKIFERVIKKQIVRHLESN